MRLLTSFFSKNTFLYLILGIVLIQNAGYAVEDQEGEGEKVSPEQIIILPTLTLPTIPQFNTHPTPTKGIIVIPTFIIPLFTPTPHHLHGNSYIHPGSRSGFHGLL